jgi:hypothetical protein
LRPRIVTVDARRAPTFTGGISTRNPNGLIEIGAHQAFDGKIAWAAKVGTEIFFEMAL